jgi:hypothetical protein
MTGKSIWTVLVILLAAGLLAGDGSAAEPN